MITSVQDHARSGTLVASLLTSALLTRKEAARYLNVATQTLAQWACSGRVSLPFYKIGRKAMYKICDLDAFIAANGHGGNHA